MSEQAAYATANPMDQWSNTELLAHIQRFTPIALDMVDGTDPSAPDRIDHAKDQIQNAVDILQARDYQFDYKAREKLRFVSWMPTTVDMRLMVRALVKSEPLERGIDPRDFKILLAPQGDQEATTRQYRAIGEIIIQEAIRQGAEHKDAVRAWLQQSSNATKGGSIEIAVPTSSAMWDDLGNHLHQHPETQISLHCLLPKCNSPFVSIRDLVPTPKASRPRRAQTETPTLPPPITIVAAPATQASPRTKWFQRLFHRNGTTT
jgi:hypothetical protein